MFCFLCLACLLCPTGLASPLHLPPSNDQPQHVLSADAPAKPQAAAPRRLHGKFLHITDIHPDEFYKVHASADEGYVCHHGKGSAGVYGAPSSGCDTPYSLVNATFDWIAANLRDEIDFVVWTGDSARHDSDESIPRSASEVQGSNQRIADRLADIFASPSGRGLAIPVVPTLGNNDILPHNVLPPGPNKWLTRYAELWQSFIPQEQRHAFEYGGWFYVEVIPNRLAVFSLNTLYFFDRNAGIDDCIAPSEPGFKQFEWLRVQLAFLRQRGVKALLMGHVPPARTGSKQLWDETCWQKYTLWLRQYRDVVVGGLFGHMNIDHFLLHDSKEIDYALLGLVDDDGADDNDDDADYLYEDEGTEEGAGPHKSIVRVAMEDELDVRSTADYLQELRNWWSKLPKPPTVKESDAVNDDDSRDNGPVGQKTKKKKKNKKKKKPGPKLPHKWAERFQLSLVSPSIVPNYFPGLRVIEYNITGLEDAPVWSDGPGKVPMLADGVQLSEAETMSGKGKGKKGKKGKGKKGGKGKKDPNLIVPDGPDKTAAPGPAYSAQPLTLVGYTQYFANLTHLNNEKEAAAAEAPSSGPKDVSYSEALAKPASPLPFRFDVEYSTFTDKIYDLSDLTVNSFVEMAYRIGRGSAGSKAADASGIFDEAASAAVEDETDDDVAEEKDEMGDKADSVDTDDDADDEEVDAVGKKKGKKHKKKKKKKINAVWLHFLRHAFVSTLDEDELKKMG